MKTVLGIETSCDETAVAIVTEDKRILVNKVLSQQEHARFGGVVPEIAARAHLHHIDHMVKEALREAPLDFSDLDAIAVTAGPGLIGGLLVGVMTARAIADVHKIPLIAINHLEGHALSPRLAEAVPFPYLLLLASGGHCQILIVEGVGRYRLLGATIDDAAGECFDKTAKLLGLDYPGGPAIEKMAINCKDVKAAMAAWPFPAPFKGADHCNFSFSGLKTAVRRAVEALPEVIAPDIAADICASFQESVASIIEDRMERAIHQYLISCPKTQQPTLVVAGGVAANQRLRASLMALCGQKGLHFAAPPMHLCTDNAAMIAWAGLERLGLGWTNALDFPVYPRWPLDAAQGKVHT